MLIFLADILIMESFPGVIMEIAGGCFLHLPGEKMIDSDFLVFLPVHCVMPPLFDHSVHVFGKRSIKV
ncbi:MAG: hypothetical protein EA394_10070, partial [Bacteroidia bacterium]